MLVLSAFSLPEHRALGSSSYSIVMTKSGLVARDRLNNTIQTKQQVLANTSYWTYYGTVYEKQTTFDVYKDYRGLHIGEPGPDHAAFGDSAYSGFYAVSPWTNAVLVHAVLTATDQPVRSQFSKPARNICIGREHQLPHLLCGHGFERQILEVGTRPWRFGR